MNYFTRFLPLLTLLACGGSNDSGASAQDSDADGDADGYTSIASGGLDCDDADASVNPGASEVCGDTIDQDCVDGDLVCSTAALPVAPSPEAFGWQGRQTDFLDAEGNACAAPVVLAMGDQATCYVDPSGELRCAGRVYTETYGNSFAATGQKSVTEVIVTLTSGAEDGNNACAVVGGTPKCLGAGNYAGQLGNGGNGANAGWVPWVAGGNNFVTLATGTTDQYCALNTDGATWCTGYGFGTTPVEYAAGPATALWVDEYGSAIIDDGVTARASQGRSSCTVTEAGLSCGGYGNRGRAGHVVDGGLVLAATPGHAMTWIEDDGVVYRHTYDMYSDTEVTETIFGERPALAIAYNSYSDSVCAVLDDGSLACLGSNTQGKLGTGDTETLDSETVVLPAGSFDIRCR